MSELIWGLKQSLLPPERKIQQVTDYKYPQQPVLIPQKFRAANDMS